jgi:hypothetical protein
MNEYLITVAIYDLGRPDVAGDNAERLLEAFSDVHPKAGPAVGANLELGQLEVTFSIDAEDHNRAFDAGWAMFHEGTREAGLEVDKVARIEVAVLEPELEPALA